MRPNRPITPTSSCTTTIPSSRHGRTEHADASLTQLPSRTRPWSASLIRRRAARLRVCMRSKRWVFVAVLSAVLAASCGGGSDQATRSPTTAARAATNATSTTLPITEAVPGSQLAGDVAFLGPSRTVKVGDVTMAFRRFGAGPDLLLIAGQASPMSLWPASLLRELAAGHRVTIYDNRDLGDTKAPRLPFDLTDLADDAAGLITALGLRRPQVFGWSTGGEIGLLLASRHPDALSKLAITGATPGGPRSVQPPPEIVELFADPNPDTNKLFDVLFSPTAAGKKAQ